MSNKLKKKAAASAKAEREIDYSTKGAVLYMKDNAVAIISAFRPKAEEEGEREKEKVANISRGIEACRFASLLGLLPMCPHIYATRFLDDDNENERAIGMNISKTWMRLCGQAWIWGYTGPDSISKGMRSDIRTARYTGIPVLAFPEPGEFFRLMEEATRGMDAKEGNRYIWSVINRSAYHQGAEHAPVYDILEEDREHGKEE